MRTILPLLGLLALTMLAPRPAAAQTDPAEFRDDYRRPAAKPIENRELVDLGRSAVSLYDVVRHCEAGGIERPSRSSAITKLELSERDRRDLVAFLQTLTGMPEGETRPKLPAAKQ